ncbi:hypothetical protein HAHE_17630 [Haloferula helveola]|uniref:M23ase beta-sheet core domain-containing protein n=1 Tax=Haloferula helveola TaxID=490095 RepID=A0ABN6H8Q1_9BACT|nr:hypothetical protein HAHE_17630 [Haloferula helveola]
MKLFNPITLLLILIGAAMVGFVWLRGPSHELPPVESLANFQMADAPLKLPADGQPRHRLHRMSAWDLATLPRAVRFDPPMGTEQAGLTYNAQKFWEMNNGRGGHHTGDDLNGIGGMNSDLGDPVFAAADGRVLYAGEPSPGWGNTVVVAHHTADGRVLQTMYAHLQNIDVPVGAAVARGRVIGSVGTANGYYPAHLHFEMRESDGVDIGAGYSMNPMNRLDPEATIASMRGAPADRPSPAVLPVALDRGNPWNQVELSPEDAAKLGEILKREPAADGE